MVMSVCLFFSCASHGGNLEIEQRPIAVNSNQNFSKVICANSNNILCGTEYSDRLDNRTAQTIIRWLGSTEFEVKVPGVFSKAYYIDSVLYFITQVYESKQNPENSFHNLHKLSLRNKNVEKLYEWSEGNQTFGKIHFYSIEEGCAYVFSHNTNLGQFIMTNNSGKNWGNLETKFSVSTPKFMFQNIHFASSKHRISSISKNGELIDSVESKLNLKDFTVIEKDNYWLLGKDGERTVLQHYKDGNIEEIKTFSDEENYFPDKLYKYNNTIVVITSWIDKSMLGGFGGTRAKLFLSIDNGLTWESEPLDIGLDRKSICFYKDERMTAYMYHGELVSIYFNR